MAHRLRTRAIHAGIDPGSNRGATSIPIYNTSSYAFDSAQALEDAFAGRRPAHVYSRVTNPTTAAFEQRIAALEGGLGSVATASGMAAIQGVLHALAENGSRIVVARSLFGGTTVFLREVAARLGITPDYVDMDDEISLARALDAKHPGGRPRLLFFETLGNPKLDIPPIAEATAVARENGVPTVIDATLSTPALFDAKAAGATAVIHSTTKYITGSGTVIGGVVTDLGTFDWSRHESAAIAQAVGRFGAQAALFGALRRQAGMNAGLTMAPLTAFLAALGLETLVLRMTAHAENAQTVAKALAAHKGVQAVRYPGLPDDRYHERVAKYFRGAAGALVTVDVGSRERAFALCNRLELALRASNFGDAKTLVIHPASTIFRDCSDEERAFSGVTDGLLRVSVGLEDPDDIIDDFAQALDALDS